MAALTARVDAGAADVAGGARRTWPARAPPGPSLRPEIDEHIQRQSGETLVDPISFMEAVRGVSARFLRWPLVFSYSFNERSISGDPRTKARSN